MGFPNLSTLDLINPFLSIKAKKPWCSKPPATSGLIEAKILKGKQIQFTAAEGDMQFKDAGLKLTVTPQIVGDGNVIMELAITNDEVSGAGANPAISKMEINTKLIVADGSVVAIGGIYTQNESVGASKVPILGDLPGIGRLFRKDSIADTQTQIIIFIAPKIV